MSGETKKQEALILFTVRKVEEGDAEGIAKHLNNKKIYENTQRVPYPYTIEDAHNWIKKTLEMGYDKPVPTLNFTIEIGGEASGVIGIEQTAEGEAELGYWLAEPYWGNGVMTEIVTQFCDYCFETVGLKKLTAGVFKRNKPSQRVMEKCGFKIEGERVAQKDGKEIEEFIFVRKK